MKRREFIKHLGDKGCVLSREGGKYSIYKNPVTNKEIPVTRHTEIADFTVRKICRDLGIEPPQ
ncbi:MAG: type II toxin-antitoxin system HicA family toxin [Elusimicrobia bacterium]|nr:type II toxin-antitoxin system HicA family toxin [Elusimicrobiota bacterium]